MEHKRMTAVLLLAAFLGLPSKGRSQTIVYDSQKEKQWKSMENGPWDFSPDWYYYFMHNSYSGAEMYWEWSGLSSGFRVRFKESKSNVQRIMPVRVTAEETQRQKADQVEDERQDIGELYEEELVREADRTVDLAYSSYKEEFNRMQERITEGLLYCLQKSGGGLSSQVDELNRQYGLLCADIAYIHKTGAGYELENARRQQAYEDAKVRMAALVESTARLCAVAATHY